jgi:hypothetical protein
MRSLFARPTGVNAPSFRDFLDSLQPFERNTSDASPVRLSSPARIAATLARIEQEITAPAFPVLVRICGGSMMPTFQPDELAELHPTTFPRLGSVVVAEVLTGNLKGCFCKRLFLGAAPDTFDFVPDCAEYPTLTFHRSEVRILGEALKRAPETVGKGGVR